MNERQQVYLTTVPASAAGIFERAFGGSASRANAIKAKCLACTNFQRDEVRECPTVLCPLHPIRPFQVKVAKPKTNIEAEGYDPDLDGDDPLDADDDL